MSKTTSISARRGASSPLTLTPGSTIPGTRGVIPSPEQVAAVLRRIAKAPQAPGEAERVYRDVTERADSPSRLSAEQVFEAWKALPLRSRKALARRIAKHLDEPILPDDLLGDD